MNAGGHGEQVNAGGLGQHHAIWEAYVGLGNVGLSVYMRMLRRVDPGGSTGNELRGSSMVLVLVSGICRRWVKPASGNEWCSEDNAASLY